MRPVSEEAFDNKLRAKLNTLEVTVMALGDQIQSLNVRQQLQCHVTISFFV